MIFPLKSPFIGDCPLPRLIARGYLQFLRCSHFPAWEHLDPIEGRATQYTSIHCRLHQTSLNDSAHLQQKHRNHQQKFNFYFERLPLRPFLPCKTATTMLVASISSIIFHLKQLPDKVGRGNVFASGSFENSPAAEHAGVPPRCPRVIIVTPAWAWPCVAQISTDTSQKSAFNWDHENKKQQFTVVPLTISYYILYPTIVWNNSHTFLVEVCQTGGKEVSRKFCHILPHLFNKTCSPVTLNLSQLVLIFLAGAPSSMPWDRIWWRSVFQFLDVWPPKKKKRIFVQRRTCLSDIITRLFHLFPTQIHRIHQGTSPPCQVNHLYPPRMGKNGAGRSEMAIAGKQ